MRHLRAATLAFLASSAPAFAADNAALVTPCASGCLTLRSRDVGAGVQSLQQILGDTSGNAIYGAAGTANANVLSVQGIASMTPLLATVTGNLTNISGTISLPTGAATQATLASILTNLGSPFQAGGSIGNTTFAATQATAANLNATVVGTGTFAVQAASTLAAETTKVIGTVRNLGNAGAIFDGATGAAVPANVLYLGMNQGGNLTGLTGTSGSLNVNITGGGGSGGTSSTFGAAMPTAGTAIGLYDGTNMVRAKGDETSGIWVNVKAGAGSGGTALADGATFTEATTNFTPVGGEYVSGGGANCTTGKGCTWQMTIDRAGYVNNYKWAGGVLGAMANYGTSPGAVLVPGVNAFVTNSNANGSATSANSSPIVIASDQAAVAVKGNAASGSAVSGNPNLVAGSDGTNARTLATDTRGDVKVINGGSDYETVAASQTAQVMGATGATGDYLSHCIATPGTTSPGVVTILDNASAIVSFPGGASSVSNLVPFAIPMGAVSTSGAWKITTGANITVVCVGRFT